jgi:hypothetical protein
MCSKSFVRLSPIMGHLPRYNCYMITREKHHNYLYVYLVLGFGVLISKWPQIGGEDLNQARTTWLSGIKTDFLGATSVFFYGNLPDSPIPWYEFLTILQISLTTSGLILLHHKIILHRTTFYRSLFYFYSYLIICFVSWQTRDATMISFIFFGLGLLTRFSFFTNEIKFFKSKSIQFSILFISISSLIFAFSFRPWLSPCLVIIFFLAKPNFLLKMKSFVIKLLLCVSLLVSPLLFDQGIKLVAQINDGFPEQTVELVDLSQTYCWSINPETSTQALEGIKLFSKNPDVGKYICQFLKPNSYGSLFAKSGIYPTTVGYISPINFLDLEDAENGKKLRRIWLTTIASDPISYIQNKFISFSQVVLGGESRNIQILQTFPRLLELFTFQNFLIFLKTLYLLPYDLMTTFHGFSPILIFIFWVCFLIYRYWNLPISAVFNKDLTLSLSLFIFWILMTSIAFIGDNGRYTFGASALLILALFRTPNKFSLK